MYQPRIKLEFVRRYCSSKKGKDVAEQKRTEAIEKARQMAKVF